MSCNSNSGDVLVGVGRKETQPAELMRAHADLQLGTFFSKCEQIAPGLCFVSSERIADFYWNYAFAPAAPRGVFAKAHYAQIIRQHAADRRRQPVFYAPNQATPFAPAESPNLLAESSEAWLVRHPAELAPAPLPACFEVAMVGAHGPLDEFLQVFRDAYGPATPDAPGYSFVPETYPQALLHSAPTDGVQVTHFVGRFRTQPVAIASLFCKPPHAGLYNVGTIHTARQHHFATLLSRLAIQKAAHSGCEIVFLQTEPDSILEHMYRALGFRREFLAHFLLL